MIISFLSAVKSQNRKFEFDNPVSEEATSLVEVMFTKSYNIM